MYLAGMIHLAVLACTLGLAAHAQDNSDGRKAFGAYDLKAGIRVR